MNSIFTVLLNYNGCRDTINCINSIRKNDDSSINIIVVDNNSSDNSQEELSKINNITFVESGENGGFAKGNNIGIRYALDRGAQYVLLLNNDTEIEKDAITKMMRTLEGNSQLAAVGSRIMYYDNPTIINYLGGKYNWIKGITEHQNYKKTFKKEEYEDFFYTDFITGCSIMIKREVLEKIGLLPEDYFMYFEDADYCLRIKEHGYKLGVCTNSTIYHKVSSSSGGEDSPFSIKWMTRYRLVFIDKYKRYTIFGITRLYIYSTRLIKYCMYKVMGKKEKAKAILEGLKLYHNKNS